MGRFRALIVALFVLPGVVDAQPHATPQQMQQAGDLARKAIAASQRGDHVVAIELYNQAYNIVPTALLLSNIGSEYQAAGKPVESIKYFCKYIEADPTGSNVGYAQAQVKILHVQLGDQVEDKDMCKPVPPKPPPGLGSGSGSGSGSGVDLGSGSAGLTGTHLGSATHDDGGKPGKGLVIAGVGVSVIGAVGIGVGIMFALKSKKLNDDVMGHDPTTAWPSSYEGVPIGQWDSQGHTWNKDGYIFSISGGVVLLVGVAMIVIGHGQGGSEEQPRVTVAPTADPHGGGMVLTGRF